MACSATAYNRKGKPWASVEPSQSGADWAANAQLRTIVERIQT